MIHVSRSRYLRCRSKLRRAGFTAPFRHLCLAVGILMLLSNVARNLPRNSISIISFDLKRLGEPSTIPWSLFLARHIHAGQSRRPVYCYEPCRFEHDLVPEFDDKATNSRQRPESNFLQYVSFMRYSTFTVSSFYNPGCLRLLLDVGFSGKLQARCGAGARKSGSIFQYIYMDLWLDRGKIFLRSPDMSELEVSLNC